DAIRFHHTGSTEPTGTAMTDGGILHIEDGLPQAVLDELKQRGHVIQPESVGADGGYQAIWRDPATGIDAGPTERRKAVTAPAYGAVVDRHLHVLPGARHRVRHARAAVERVGRGARELERQLRRVPG